jgi:Glycosyltransferase family 87
VASLDATVPRAGSRNPLAAACDALVSGPPLALAALYLWLAVKGGVFAVDFRHAFWPAGEHVLHGESPFPPVTPDALATGTAFVYPAVAALLFAPFALVPAGVAGALFVAMLVAATALALRAVDVRDWRCYAATLLWAPVLSGLQTANLTLLLALGLALLWRWRDRSLVSGATAGALLAMKLFFWPLAVWLVASRRYAGAVWAAVAALALLVGGWAVLSFAGLTDYVPALRMLARLEERASYTPLAAGLKLGLGFEAARALGLLVAATVLGAAVVLARRRRDDERSFVLALVACVLFSPVVWLHYYGLLVPALGILRPRFSVVWLTPLILLFCPARPTGPSGWALFVLATFALVLTVGLTTRREARVRLATADTA